jgi:hypothetical protein
LKHVVFWDVALCRSCVNPRFGGTYRLHLQGEQVSHDSSPLADFSTLKVEAIGSSEMWVDAKSTQRHIPEDDILHSHRCESLKCFRKIVLILRIQKEHGV